MTQAVEHRHVDLIWLSARNNRGMKLISDQRKRQPDHEAHRTAMGKRIEDLRERCELSQPALAAMADITQPSLWAIENGQTKEVTARTLFGLCHALGTTVEYLWIGSEQTEQEAMDEAELVSIFRQLLPAGRGAVLQSARTVLAAQGPLARKDEAVAGENSPQVKPVTETSTNGGIPIHIDAPSLSTAINAPRKMAAKGKKNGTQGSRPEGVQKPRARRNT